MINPQAMVRWPHGHRTMSRHFRNIIKIDKIIILGCCYYEAELRWDTLKRSSNFALRLPFLVCWIRRRNPQDCGSSLTGPYINPSEEFQVRMPFCLHWIQAIRIFFISKTKTAPKARRIFWWFWTRILATRSLPPGAGGSFEMSGGESKAKIWNTPPRSGGDFSESAGVIFQTTPPRSGVEYLGGWGGLPPNSKSLVGSFPPDEKWPMNTPRVLL